MLWLTLLACYDPVTNAPLHEDALFLNALPSPAELRPPSLPDLNDADAVFLEATVQAVGDLETVVGPVLRASEALRSVQPSERSSRHRVFDPTPVIAVDVLNPTAAWWVRGTIIEPQDDVFSWTIEVAPESTGPWKVAGDGLSTPEQGTLLWDFDVSSSTRVAGSVEATWSHTSEERETTFAVSIELAAPVHFGLYGAGAMSFSFQDVELGEERVSGAALTLMIAEGGRSDARLSDGRVVAECWDADGVRVFLEVDGSQSGSEAACVLEQAVDPADW